MNNDILHKLITKLDAAQPGYAHWDAYYTGTQPLAFLAPEAREALGNRLGRIASNLPKLAITSLAERMKVSGFEGVDVWDHWLASNMDQRVGLVHREALTAGTGFVLVWADQSGRPVISADSAKQVSVLTDPATGDVTAALKRWSTDSTTEAAIYYPDRVERWTAPVTGATSGGFTLSKTVPNPLGAVPMVPFTNADRLLQDGVSEISDLAPLADLLAKTLADMAVASELTARPRRWATGIELTTDEDGNEVNPLPEGSRALIAEDAAAKFGQLAGGDLSGYRTAVDIILGQAMAVSALPSHYVGVTSSNPASADALRASEAALVARVEARSAAFGPSWERVADLTAAVASGGAVQSRARVTWSDPATRSVAQQADAVVKLYASGILPASYALRRLGYSNGEVIEIRAARRAEAIDTAGITLGGTA